MEPVPRLEAVEEGPAMLIVEGAGTAQANGCYRRNGTYDGAPMYVNGDLCIVRIRGNWYKWVIAVKETLDETEGDLYRSQTSSEYPPLSSQSWEVDEDGAEPVPTVRAVNAMGQPIMPGWVLAEVHPAQVAVATYVPQPVAVQIVDAVPV